MNANTPLTVNDFLGMKQRGEKIAMLTCYDATFARTMDQSGVDILLIGDSMGMVVQGRKSTLAVSVRDICYHTSCVANGLQRAFPISDMPFGSFHNESTAMENATRMLAAGGRMVKLEGAGPMIDVTAYLVSRGVPVCGHLGLTPQSVHHLGGFRVQARAEEDARRLLSDAKDLERAGAQLLVIECVPSGLAGEVSAALDIPTIGIGAGAACDGQVLVMHDMLGLGDWRPRFVEDFMDGARSIGEAFEKYVSAVRDGSFPGAEHEY
jgi:3-methyl-2-oxobutanoate hydroxymethyltransferase